MHRLKEIRGGCEREYSLRLTSKTVALTGVAGKFTNSSEKSPAVRLLTREEARVAKLPLMGILCGGLVQSLCFEEGSFWRMIGGGVLKIS
jgi:hypothetical protein